MCKHLGPVQVRRSKYSLLLLNELAGDTSGDPLALCSTEVRSVVRGRRRPIMIATRLHSEAGVLLFAITASASAAGIWRMFKKNGRGWGWESVW